MNRNTYVALVVLIMGLPGFIMSGACSAPNHKPVPRAAIIDQLCILQPNEVFIQKTNRELEKYGFQVDVRSGNEITVDFYRELPTYGYNLLIFRVHSGLLSGDPRIADMTWLFTDEPYNKARHTIDQLADRVTFARVYDEAPWFFAISSKFIAESLEGQFNDTTIVMMGCDCMHLPDMAEAFVKKGASAYIGWNLSVGLGYVDDAALNLVGNLCSQKFTVAEAVAATMKAKGPDPDNGAVLQYYPRQSGNKTIAELIQ